MSEKSILEQALLQVQTLEEAVKANAKGILASTMKQELNELLKESKKEEEEEVNEQPDPEDEDTKDVSDEPSDDEEETSDETPEEDDDEDNTSMSDDSFSSEDDDSTSSEDYGSEDDDFSSPDDTSFSDDTESPDSVMDMSGSSDEEVLAVFKKMKPEDGIIVKKDGDDLEIELEDENYIIKLDESVDHMEEEESMEEVIKLLDPSDILSRVVQVVKDFDPGDWDVQNMTYQELNDKLGEIIDEIENDDSETAEEYSKLKRNFEHYLGKDHLTDDMSTEIDEETVYEIELDDAKEEEMKEAARTKWNPHGNKGGANRSGLPSKKVFKAGSGVTGINEEFEKLKKQNSEYKKALVLFKDKLNEVAVFNANLAYATRLFTEHSTTKQEKLNILKRFDSISTMNESKNLFNVIKSELETKKPVTESVVEKITSAPSSSSTEVLSESKAYENPQFKRMKDLMTKIK